MMLPYEALMQTQGLTKKDLPSEIQTLIKRIEATRNSIAIKKKVDENGNYIVSDNVKRKIQELDSEIVNKTWDYLEDKQRNEIRKSSPSQKVEQKTEKTEPIKEQEVPKSTEQVEPKSEKSDNGRIGFFGF